MTVHVVNPNLFSPALAALRRQADELRAAAEDEALCRWAEQHRERVKAVFATAAAIASKANSPAHHAPPPECPRNRAQRRAGLRRGR
jgi:hypothetical protein